LVFLLTQNYTRSSQAVTQATGRKPLLAEYCPSPYTTNQRKSKLVTFLLGFFVGNFGADRFYLGYIGAGIGKLITSGGFGIWTLIGMFSFY